MQKTINYEAKEIIENFYKTQEIIEQRKLKKLQKKEVKQNEVRKS